MKDLLKYGLIASAGQPRSLTGEALIGLGALLSQMDFKLGEDKEVDEVDPERLRLETDTKAAKAFSSPKLGEKIDLSAKNPFLTMVTNPNITHSGIFEKATKVIQGSSGETQKEEDAKNDQLDYSAVENAISKSGVNLEERIADVESGDIIADSANNYNVNLQNALQQNYVMPGGRRFRDVYNEQIQKEKGGEEPYLEGLKQRLSRLIYGTKEDPNKITTNVDSILAPSKRLKPEVLEILDGARYKNKGKDDTPLHRVAHITNSPYLRTDNVDYRQMRQATAPGYTGEIGKAAIEGYNLVIDKYNYDQAVKADYEEEIEDQMGSLNVEADFLTDQARQDYLELSMGKKKRLNEAFNSYANGDISKLDYENVKASLVSELQSAAATRTNITNSIKDFIENKGTIDTEASDPEMLDFLMTGEKSPERISIKNIDGVDYVTGTTRGGRDFKIPTSKIANGTAGFRVVKKASLAPVISGALKNINAYTSTVKTDLGFGLSTPDPKKAKDIGIASIRTNLGSNEADLRSIMAQIYGVNHTAYQNFLGSDPTANKSAMLDDAAEYLYDTQVAEKYFPMTKTTRFTTEKTGSTTAGERKIAKIKADLDKLPPLSSSTLSSYASQLDKKIYELKKDPKTGSFYINDFKNKRRINLPSDPIEAKTEIAGYAGVTGYSQAGQLQDVSQYNFDL